MIPKVHQYYKEITDHPGLVSLLQVFPKVVGSGEKQLRISETCATFTRGKTNL